MDDHNMNLSVCETEDSVINNQAGIADIAAKPFVKWAGGKRNLVPILLNHAPQDFRHYHEIFLGGGALFFALNPKNAFLSDINLDLITTYQVIQQQPHALINALTQHKNHHNETYYYRIRKRFALDDAVEIAARFIYLNKTCYNGLYRVNNKGEFNVPMGRYDNPLICDEQNILSSINAAKGR